VKEDGEEIWKLNSIGRGWNPVNWDDIIRFDFGQLIILKVYGAKTPFDDTAITGFE
jgi:hypothetical protein